jgi:hypothetical protein
VTELNRALTGAAEKGIISAHQVRDLEDYLADRGFSFGPAVSDARADLRDDALEAQAAEDSEQPRFLRGFHDILITIGVVVVLIGLWGLGGPLATLPVMLVLAEILVRRQRLALPSVVLTVALVHWIATTSLYFVGEQMDAWKPLTFSLAYFSAFPIPLGLFYLRYRVPLALAGLVLSVALIGIFAVLIAFEQSLGFDLANGDRFMLIPITSLVGAFSVFAVAMRYDVSDPQRLTARSDTAFWLHLAAAPALLYSLMGLVFLSEGGVWWDGQAGSGQAVAAILIVVAFMLVGLVIDRRAFVTSGLLSLGGAIWTVLGKTGASLDSYVFIAFAIVGVTVLFIGIFWQRLRRMVIDLLPETMTARLHAAP